MANMACVSLKNNDQIFLTQNNNIISAKRINLNTPNSNCIQEFSNEMQDLKHKLNY